MNIYRWENWDKECLSIEFIKFKYYIQILNWPSFTQLISGISKVYLKMTDPKIFIINQVRILDIYISRNEFQII